MNLAGEPTVLIHFNSVHKLSDPSVFVKDRMKTFKYERVIPTHMAKGSGMGMKDASSKKGDKPEKDKEPKKDDKATKADKSKKGDKFKKGGKPKREAAKRSRFSPIKTQVHESGIKEVSALRAFLTSFVFFSLILSPVLGLGLYFVWDVVVDYFPTPEGAFMAGMGIGLAVSFVIAVLFTRKAVATA